MCRVFAVVSSARRSWRQNLVDAPRSLRALSHEHAHGWGVAVHTSEQGWSVERRPVAAYADEGFAVASERSGTVLLAHVRQGTVGAVAALNTHPFRRGRWVFMHNGTIASTAWLRAGTHPRRAAEIEGETDSEVLFAWLLTRLDERSRGDVGCDAVTDDVLREAFRAARASPGIGAINAVLSDGATVYAHRWGRTLFVQQDGGHTIAVASEPEGSTPGWITLDEGSLLRIDHGAPPVSSLLDGTYGPAAG